MKQLNKAELDCLRNIAKGYSELTSPCAEQVLKNLSDLGLIAQTPGMWLPLEMMRFKYYLTTAGRRYIDT